MKLVIAGAKYYSEKNNAIVIPRFTGEYYAVDCDRFLTKKEIIERYNERFFKTVKDNYIEYDGEKYYPAEWSPFWVDDFDLISNLSELRHQEL